MDDKDRDEARKEAFEFVEIIYKGIANNLDYSPTWKVLERDARIRADERRRCAILAMIYADNHGQEIAEGNLRGLYTAVLQGTGPANNHDHNAIVQALQNMIEYAETAIAHEKESNGHPRNKRYHDEMDADLKEAKTVLKELENNG